MNLTKSEAKELREAIAEAADDIMDAYGFRLIDSRIRWSSVEGTLKFVFNQKITDEIERPVTTEDQLHSGLTKPGTVCWLLSSEDHLYYKVEILRTNQKNYVFQWLNYPEQGQYLASFRFFRHGMPPIEQIEPDELTL